ncbi:sensor histidine kinase [Novosphingobium sp. Fuku2-ISO-50]|uniref:sensor histidine kinase n=1 Tax=Novosphingobium sp. Fuku2-ISO-50 TaxID=1739114 RepID=UPI00076D2563|nr:histidine kinase [Novosphingobium sp. Fuku2-ISO-50]KUR77040.1 histidine kinase [Novosphingobium sp. Fuku2-ISO-50]
MAMLPLPPTPFFGNKNRAFWRLQFLGWGGALLLRAMSSLANAVPWSFLIIVIIATITGFSISLILSVIYRALINRRAIVTWGVTAVVLAIAVGLYAFIDSWVVSLYRTSADSSFAQLFLGVFYLDLTLLGAWSALYYAINFYIQVEEQNHQLLQLENQATSAQLAMLRYQLNPHFLFNTLNSISTLVLLKQTEPANAMLSRLSSFLRYTLINEPTARVTVAQEVETLKLYLGIELMRFEERLRTQFQIDDAARDALMPSLLLQPLVENAIKYAVSPMEEGAEITINAHQIGSVLRIVISDTGPGLPPGIDPAELFGANHDMGHDRGHDRGRGHGTQSTGVGLANIRDRLVQAYGDNQRFDIVSGADGGVIVTIELPFEVREAAPRPPRSVQPALNPAVAG